MKKIFSILLLSLISLPSFAHDYLGNTNIFRIFTEDNFQPFNYYNSEGKLEGVSVEIADKILSDARFKHTKVTELPWARAYHTVAHHRNTGLFSIYRIPVREELFEWVGPITSSKLVIIKRKDTQLENNYSVAAVRNSASFQTLEEKGYGPDRILSVNDSRLGLNLLNRGRADAWALTLTTAKRIIKESQLDFNDYEVLEVLNTRDIYFALNKQTDPKIKEYFHKKMKELKESGFIDKLLEKYDYNPSIYK